MQLVAYNLCGVFAWLLHSLAGCCSKWLGLAMDGIVNT